MIGTVYFFSKIAVNRVIVKFDTFIDNEKCFLKANYCWIKLGGKYVELLPVSLQATYTMFHCKISIT